MTLADLNFDSIKQGMRVTRPHPTKPLGKETGGIYGYGTKDMQTLYHIGIFWFDAREDVDYLPTEYSKVEVKES